MNTTTRFDHCAGLAALEHPGPLVMGVLNTTPDSFSDGGSWGTIDRAVAHAERMMAEGAHLIDIGGESTRPGAHPVERTEELRRVLPVIERLAGRCVLSIDTTGTIDDFEAEVHRVEHRLLVGVIADLCTASCNTIAASTNLTQESSA